MLKKVVATDTVRLLCLGMVSISTVHRTVGKSWKLLEGYGTIIEHRTINAMAFGTPTGEETAHKGGGNNMTAAIAEEQWIQ